MMAALAARESGRRVTIVERQARLGRKLLSTGNGRCNLTNISASPSNYHGENPEFAAPALEAFSPEDTLSYFSSLGLMVSREYGGRVYPLSNQANSVLDVLRYALSSREVEILSGAPVLSARKNGRGFSVRLEDRTLECSRLIIACGGCAGSRLGGVTDGYELLKGFGHSRTALHPALTQVKTDTAYPRSLKGVRADAEITLKKGGKALASRRGELLFTDTGVSGTAIFELSRSISLAGSGARLEISFFPGMKASGLEAHIRHMAEINPTLPANAVLTGTVHNRLGQMLCKYAGISALGTASELTQCEISAIASACLCFTLGVTGVSGFESAQVTAGGIRTSEFDPETLESRLVPGLYACGEVFDIDGDCGGYNLQWAWSSGRKAGLSAV